MSRHLKTGEYGTWYVAGPMTNLPQFNFPAFDAAAAALRTQGFAIISPAELDSPEMRAAAYASPNGDLGQLEAALGHRESWGSVLARDVQVVADRVIGVILLPGWENSRGALLEVAVALLCGKAFRVYEDDPDIGPVTQVRSTFWVFAEWVSGMWRKVR